LVVTLIVVLKSPSVDYDKQAQEAAEARKRQYEEFSKKEDKTPSAAPAAAKPTPAPTPSSAKPAGSTECKPLPSPAAPSPAPAAAPNPPTLPSAQAESSGAALSSDLIGRLRSEVLELHPFYLGLVVTPAEKLRLNALAASGRGTTEDASFVESLLNSTKLKVVKDEVAQVAQTLPTLERESQENLPVDRVTYIESGRVMNCRILEEGAELIKVSPAGASGVRGQIPIRREAIRIEKG